MCRQSMGEVHMEEVSTVATIECPYCSEQINAKSKKCRYCGEIIDPQMRELELLKSHRSSQVFMNAGGGGGAAAVSSEGGNLQLRRFPHWIHVILTIVTGGIWLFVYILLFIFRNKRYYI